MTSKFIAAKYTAVAVIFFIRAIDLRFLKEIRSSFNLMPRFKRSTITIIRILLINSIFWIVVSPTKSPIRVRTKAR